MQGFDTSGTETKGTVLIRSGEELETYAKSEEARMEEIVKGVAAAGVRIVFSGAAIGEMAMHFLEKYDIMAVRVPSKFDLRRVCRTTGAIALVKVQPPTPEEVGHVAEVALQELGGTRCVVVRQSANAAGVTTVVLRGSTEGLLADVERAVRLPVPHACSSVARFNRRIDWSIDCGHPVTAVAQFWLRCDTASVLDCAKASACVLAVKGSWRVSAWAGGVGGRRRELLQGADEGPACGGGGRRRGDRARPPPAGPRQPAAWPAAVLYLRVRRRSRGHPTHARRELRPRRRGAPRHTRRPALRLPTLPVCVDVSSVRPVLFAVASPCSCGSVTGTRATVWLKVEPWFTAVC